MRISELTLNNKSYEFRKNLYSIVKYFDQVVCPQFKRKFSIDPLLIPSNKSKRSKIIILVDDKLPHLGFHSRILETKYNRDFIILDLKEDSFIGDQKYLLPHELQHVVRHHFNRNEEDWLNEGLSVVTEFLMTEEFPIKYLREYKSLGNLSLIDHYQYNIHGIKYFNNFLYVYYLYQNFGGIELVKRLIMSPYSGVKNIDSVIKAVTKNKKDLSSFASFKGSFINYQLALVLNLYRNQIESNGGILELKLALGGVPAQDQDYIVNTGVLPVNVPISLMPASSQYYDLSKKCVNVTVEENSSLVAVLIDMDAPDSEPYVKEMKPNKNYCISRESGIGQYLIIINPDHTKKQKFMIE